MPFQGFGEIAEKLRRSTVHVTASGHPGTAHGGGQGSGIIVKPQGLIVTNAHVAASTPVSVELWDGTRQRADLVSRDADRDLAVLRVARSGLPAATLGDSGRLRVGELVIAIGNPLGFIGALTTGVVHSMGRVPGLSPYQWVQATVQLAPGNSGGPLADARGRVIGMNTMVAGGIGLAIPSNAIRSAIAGGARRAVLGVSARPIEITIAGRNRLGLVIAGIEKGGPAEFASLAIGDILVGIAGKNMDSLEDLECALEGDAERVVRVEFLRDRRPVIRSVAVRIGFPRSAAA